MKISFILPTVSKSGGIRVVAIYADRLAKRGHEVTVIAPPLRKPTLFAQARSLVKGKRFISWRPYDDTYFNGSAAKLRFLDRSRRIQDEDVPDGDVVIATWWLTAEWISDLAPTKGAKTYFIQHHEIHPNQPESRVRATWHLPYHRIVISEWLASIARNEYGVEPVAVIPNGVDVDLFSAPPRSRQPDPTVGFMYSPVNFKGCDIALNAIGLVREKIPNLRVVAFGAVPELDTLPLPKCAIYHQDPKQDHLREIYGSCDAWLFTSRNEGFGLPILEAMACRTPVIATHAGAAPELVSEGGGLLVDSFNSDDIASKIEAFFDMDTVSWSLMSDAALQTARENTWEKAVDKFEGTLRRIVATGGS